MNVGMGAIYSGKEESSSRQTFITNHFLLDLILRMVLFKSLSQENMFRIKENEMENLPTTKEDSAIAEEGG